MLFFIFYIILGLIIALISLVPMWEKSKNFYYFVGVFVVVTIFWLPALVEIQSDKITKK